MTPNDGGGVESRDADHQSNHSKANAKPLKDWPLQSVCLDIHHNNGMTVAAEQKGSGIST